MYHAKKFGEMTLRCVEWVNYMQIGRKRPSEADSDLDDAQSESSDEEWEEVDPSDEVRPLNPLRDSGAKCR